ncbi:MAG: metal ABC transporter ATP-binding protein [Magnetovibrio sp.]|nr:metal ABC transporter ATP-binding protein [Magnetovibrio sp.]
MADGVAIGAAPLVETTGLGVRRGGHWLIHDIDLTVARGEIVTVIGPNGGGKTTLVKALLGIITPDAGRVHHASGLRAGYVPQRIEINRVLPLNVERLMTVTFKAPRADVEAALAETGVAELIDQPVQTLSGGEFQRVMLARALLRRPDLLVLDEPVQGVDYAGEAALYDLISDIRSRRDVGVLMVSHDLHVVMRATDRVICLNAHVCCTGAPQTVTRDAEYQRLFGPKAATAYAVYEHHHDHHHDVHGNVVGADGGHHHHHHPQDGAGAGEPRR